MKMDKGIELVIGEDRKARLREEPHCTIDCETEEDFKRIEEAMKQYRGWISVEDRLPKWLENVFVWYSGAKEVVIDWIDMDGNFNYEERMGKVTHWQPLPAPPVLEKCEAKEAYCDEERTKTTILFEKRNQPS